MKKMLLSYALLALLSSAHVAEAKKEKITSFDQFAQEYKALFGKNPSKKIWNLGHYKNQGAACQPSCSDSGECAGKIATTKAR